MFLNFKTERKSTMWKIWRKMKRKKVISGMFPIAIGIKILLAAGCISKRITENIN